MISSFHHTYRLFLWWEKSSNDESRSWAERETVSDSYWLNPPRSNVAFRTGSRPSFQKKNPGPSWLRPYYRVPTFFGQLLEARGNSACRRRLGLVRNLTRRLNGELPIARRPHTYYYRLWTSNNSVQLRIAKKVFLNWATFHPTAIYQYGNT